MSQDTVAQHASLNPCCQLLQKKESKLSQKLAKSEEGRKFLKKAIAILQDKIANFEGENRKLSQELEQERKRAEDKGDEKIEDLATRVALENELSALRSEISYLKQRRSSVSEDEGEKVVILQARVSEGQKETIFLKEQLQKEQIRVENERKVAEMELKKANEALKSAEAELTRAEKLQASNEREMKMKESTIRISSENEISSSESQIRVLNQQSLTGAQHVRKEAILLKESIPEQKAELTHSKELLQKEKDRADSEKKKADEERKKSDEEKIQDEIVRAENERALEAKDIAARVSLEDEISSLKSQITLLQKQAVTGAQDLRKEIVVLRERISDKETEINRLNELLQIEKHRADSERKKAEEIRKEVDEKEVWAEKLRANHEREMELEQEAIRLPLESEISTLKSQLEQLQQKVVLGAQELRKNAQAQDNTTFVLHKHLFEWETEIDRLKKLLQEEKERADSNKKEVSLFQSLVFEKEAEINQLQKLVDKERRKSESEKKKAEACKKKVNESQIIAMTQKSRADEERRLASIERKKVEEYRIQLERLKADVGDLRANKKPEASTSKPANEKLDLRTQKAIKERQHADVELAKAEEQSKLSGTDRKKIVEEKDHADCLSQWLKEDRGGNKKLQEKKAEHASSSSAGKGPGDLVEHMDLEAVKLKGSPPLEVAKRESGASKTVLNCLQCEEMNKKLEEVKQEAKKEKERADSEMRKAEYQRKVADTYEEKNRVKTNRCEQLARELEDSRCKTEELKKEIHELVSSRTLVKMVDDKNGKSETTRMKLLKKELKLEKMQAKHAKQVASLEKDRSILLRQEIRGIKEEFSRISDHLDILDKCSSHGNVGLNKPEKNCNALGRQGTKRKFLDDKLCQVHYSGNELVKPSSTLDASYAFKHHKQSALLLLSKDFTESISGFDSKLVPLSRDSKQTLLKTSAITSSITTFSDRTLAESQDRDALYVGKVNKSAEGTANLQLGDVQGSNHACMEEPVDACGNNLGSFNEVADCEYLKLLCLDNPSDEETYRAVIERPLSPTLPNIRRWRVFGKDNDGQINVVPPGNNIMVASCCPDEEINISKPYADSAETFHAPLYPEKVVATGSHYVVENGETGHTSDPSNSGLLCNGHEGLDVSGGSNYQPACSPSYYVIFSDINSNKSISKIFSATKTCMAQCSILSQMDRLVQMTLSTVLKTKDLLPREMVCVFFSLLLQSFPEFALDNFKIFTDVGVVLTGLFAEQVHSVIGDLETMGIFETELLSLIEDFLIHRRVVLYRNVSSESVPVHDPIGDIVISGGDILSLQAASDQKLLASSAVLASICLAVDYIGFVCETSYNMLRMRKIDSSMLATLHVFAYISGVKFFTNSDHNLSMTVIKSLVTGLERERASTETSYCRPLSVLQLGFPPCKACPYSVGAVPMEVVVSMLIKELHKYLLTNASYEDLREDTVYMDFEAADSNENKKPSSDNGKIFCDQCSNYDVPGCHYKAKLSISPDTVSCKTLFNFGDVLSLLELVAANMNWSWSFTNIVLKLLEILDFCFIDKLTPAVIVLLGQLGRHGVDAKGYEDIGVVTLRGRLSLFLRQSDSAIKLLPTQVATVYALLGVVPIRFEELISSNNKPPEVAEDSGSVDCIRNWFSLLSKEQQSLSIKLLIDDVASW